MIYSHLDPLRYVLYGRHLLKILSFMLVNLDFKLFVETGLLPIDSHKIKIFCFHFSLIYLIIFATFHLAMNTLE